MMFTLFPMSAFALFTAIAMLVLLTKFDTCTADTDTDSAGPHGHGHGRSSEGNNGTNQTKSETNQTIPVGNPFPNMTHIYMSRSPAQFYAMCEEIGRCLGARRSGNNYRSSDVDSNNCIQPGVQNCDYIVAFGCDDEQARVYFELYALRRHSADSGYVAGALSVDREMGNDVVVACIWNKNDVRATLSFNWGRTNKPYKCQDNKTGLVLNVTSKKVSRSHVHCSMNLNISRFQKSNGDEFPYDYVYHILVAGGPIKGDQLLHHDARMSSNRINLHGKNPEIAQDPDYVPEQWHGMYMTWIWITWIPVSTFVSRFYKETWARTYFVHRRVWYTIHTTCMLFGVSMAMCAYLMVGYDRQQILPPPGTTEFVHAIIGAITIILFILQCLLSWFVPMLKLRFGNEKLLGWLHLIFGHTIYILGMINIILAPSLTYNVAPRAVTRKAITWLSFHAGAYIVMTVYIEWTDRHMETGGYRAFIGCPMPIVSDEEAPRPRLRKAFLFLFIVVSVVISSLTIECIRIDEVELRSGPTLVLINESDKM